MSLSVISRHHTLFLLALILCGHAHARIITPPSSSSSDLVSDGVTNASSSSSSSENLLQLPTTLSPFGFLRGESTCEQTYGFLPCTTTVVGNLFLIIVYGYLMYMAATYLSNGSELLLEILGPGIVGGLFLPILGALPDAMLILVSGLSGSKEEAQSQVSVGMGLLAGSTVMLLTIIWGTCVIVGKCDIVDSIALDSQDTRGFSLTGSGVSTDIWTCYAAMIMAISVLPFVIVQLPQLLNSTSGRHLAVLIGLIVSLCLLVAYCLYQVFQPWIQKRKLDYIRHKHVILGLLRHLKQRALGRLLKDNGEPDKEVIKKLFATIDANKDGNLTYGELRALVVGIQFEEVDLDHDDAVKRIMVDFDTSRNQLVDENEFVNGVCRWLERARGSRRASGDAGPRTAKFLSDFHLETKREHDLLDVGGQSEEDAEGVKSARWTSIKAVLLLVLGTVIAAAFADPLVDAVDNFSDATSIPAFFISFIALPLATNSSEAVSAIIFASRDKRQTASLTFSELYGAATMNNVLCLSVFLALVYVRGLTWDFSSEVLVILVVCIVMGALGSFRTAFPLWTSLLAILLYPFSLALVLFATIDANKDGNLTYGELRALVVRIQFEEVDLDHDDAVKRIMVDFDTSRNQLVDENEFVNGVCRWLERARGSRRASGDAGPRTVKFLSDFHLETKREHDLLDVGGQSEEDAEGVKSARWTSIKAVLLLVLATVIAAAFADPLVDAVDNFSDATSIPAFFISFIALPLATNSSETVSAIIFASRDKRQTASLTFSELYGAVRMNNVLCLSVFFAVVYERGLTWDFSSEVLVILVVCIVMGALGSFRTAFPLWTSLVAILLYPFSLALVYVLGYTFGWS